MTRRLVLPVAVVALGGLAACAPVKPPSPGPGGGPTQVSFEYTGSAQHWQVPAGVSHLTVSAFGAAGGHGFGFANVGAGAGVSSPGGTGGLGGGVAATVPVSPGQTLQINVGGRGVDGSNNGEDPAGGFNGGAPARGDIVSCTGVLAVGASGGGGGASDIRAGAFGLADRLVVAGGGGGGGSPYAFAHTPATEQVTGGGGGGDGGGLAGSGASGSFPAGGGTQSAGGAPGSSFASAGVAGVGGLPTLMGGCLENDHSGYRAGGGGAGGWFGGGGGGSPDVNPVEGLPGAGGGGGGSGFGPSTAQFFTGLREGNGQVTLTYAAP